MKAGNCTSANRVKHFLHRTKQNIIEFAAADAVSPKTSVDADTLHKSKQKTQHAENEAVLRCKLSELEKKNCEHEKKNCELKKQNSELKKQNSELEGKSSFTSMSPTS